jgi:hypothetical protein
MVVALRNQVEASERSAVELRPRMSNPAPTWADVRPEIEGMMAVLLGQFHTMRNLLHRYQDTGAWRKGDERTFHEFFVRLYALVDEYMTYGAALERAGFNVACKEEFKRTWRELAGIASVDPDGERGTYDEFRNGGGRSLAEFEDELSGRSGN